MDHAGKHEESKNSSQEIKSDSETLSKTLDEIDLSSNVFLDFENFSKFYEVCGTCLFFSLYVFGEFYSLSFIL